MIVPAEEWRIRLPYDKPPLSMNDRRHWREHARIKSELMEAARWKIRAARIRPLDSCTVYLEWIVPDRIRRDTDNPTATTKVLVDALVREGVIADDSPEYVRREETLIVYSKGVRALLFHIREGR